MKNNKEVKYYSIRASVFWIVVVLGVVLFLSVIISRKIECDDFQSKSVYTEYGTVISPLNNTEECYLCGSSDESMMDYYKKCDTIGIVGLNQWYVLDLRLIECDGEGNRIEKTGNLSDYGNMQGVDYQVSAIPSRGMASATVASTDGMFDETVVRKHLCQGCLDKVTKTLAADTIEGHEEYFPFCVIDFQTLELYSVQSRENKYFVRDYWVEIEREDTTIELAVYYLPKRNVEQQN